MSKRKICKECPWITNIPTNWPDCVTKMESIGKIENKKHACHMITTDNWGYNELITDKNLCIGAKNFVKKNNII